MLLEQPVHRFFAQVSAVTMMGQACLPPWQRFGRITGVIDSRRKPVLAPGVATRSEPLCLGRASVRTADDIFAIEVPPSYQIKMSGRSGKRNGVPLSFCFYSSQFIMAQDVV